ncbi:hypothetical protein MARCHEWKA_04480 [Brevundimonas phage vB_BpoS-Marchewka]|uniref:DUF6817 domain-containing protein n=1 Tax=Brevundimonas phage vB_BpoS-Marchewka TaxID=2948604 RepID=A0A9E7N4U8_9CAUD|nr:hypothetical protein MARCHEWKA_04480 [Brevundimonas phage vB_BpoS-Marchewka]UTC29404.1 hypothetical protein BAMBUS_03220 [Brevundimonas phage vB_BpoS-Bambus]
MADPIPFCGDNARLNPAKGDEGRVRVMHAHKTDDGRVISCWKLTPEEIVKVAETGEVWLSLSCGDNIPPSFVSGTPLMQAFDQDTGHAISSYRSDGEHEVQDARRFALLHHGDQKYGKRPYAYHLDGVAAVLRRWGADSTYLKAGYGHDLEEDTMQDLPLVERRATVRVRLGEEAEAYVWACTGTQATREACLEEQIAKITARPGAAPVKCADRLFNMASCLEEVQETPTDHLLKLSRTYDGEADRFISAMEPLVPAQIIEELRDVAGRLRAFLATQAN